MSPVVPDTCASGGCGTPLGVAVPVLLRLVLGSLLVFSGLMKLGIVDMTMVHAQLVNLEPRDFAASVAAFKLGLSSDAVSLIAYSVPWAEFLGGLLLILGLWTRGAALLVVALMLGFAGGIVSLMARGIDVDCPCFGALKLFCGPSPLGTCHLVRNGCFALAGVGIVLMGPGGLCLDRVGRCGGTPAR